MAKVNQRTNLSEVTHGYISTFVQCYGKTTK